MKRREFLARLGALGLMGMGSGLAGCIGASMENVPDTATNDTITRPPVATPQATGVDILARTCPKGRSCASPQCQLWTDQDNNSKCDRGWE
jgi:hypothetical protein